MAYLRTRLEQMLADLKDGKLILPATSTESLSVELAQLRYDSDGVVDLESCSPTLRSICRAYYNVVSHKAHTDTGWSGAAEAQPRCIVNQDPHELNRTLLQLHAELFEAFTGKPPNRFVPKGSSFGLEINRLGERLSTNQGEAQRMWQSAQSAGARLEAHYRESGNVRLAVGRKLPGLKTVLGGQQCLSGSGVEAIRTTMLYADTVLVPDPVHRWFEKDLPAERFSRIRMLEDLYHLSQLRPIVDAQYPDVPLLIFPSWEKLFEEHDPTTKEGIELLALDVLGEAMDASFDDIEELFILAGRDPTRLLSAIERHELFVPIGGAPGMPIGEAIAQQKKELKSTRSDQYLELLRDCGDAQFVLLAILERLGPQFHAADNANCLGAQPLFSMPVQWHYFKKCFSLQSKRLVRERALSEQTVCAIHGLTDQSSPWLANVPISDVIRLRQEMANVPFRKGLNAILSELQTAEELDLDGSLAQVARALTLLIADHSREAQRIDEEYRRRYAQIGVTLISSVGAAFVPALPEKAIVPLLSAGGIAVASLIKDLTDKAMRKRSLRRTMLGVLAASARQAH